MVGGWKEYVDNLSVPVGIGVVLCLRFKEIITNRRLLCSHKTSCIVKRQEMDSKCLYHKKKENNAPLVCECFIF